LRGSTLVRTASPLTLAFQQEGRGAALNEMEQNGTLLTCSKIAK
jgi:hypothetical protein